VVGETGRYRGTKPQPFPRFGSGFRAGLGGKGKRYVVVPSGPWPERARKGEP